MKHILEKLLNKENLTHLEMREVFSKIMNGEMDDANIAAFLVALRMKGETEEEVFVAADILRDYAEKVSIDDDVVLDTCGTGGAKNKTFNVSTTCALVLAAAGVTVAKHGNRSNSGASGSSDVLTALGVNIQMTKEETEQKIKEGGIGFLFAPLYHPAMRHVVPVRKSLGIRTIFNLLGPLANPAHVKYQVIGVFEKDLVEKYALILQRLGHKKAIVVHGEGGFDEFSLCGKSQYALLENGEISLHEVSPEDLGLEKSSLEALEGGSVELNAKITESILKGEEHGAKSDLVALNTGAALFVAGKASSLKEGVKIAKGVIVSGKAY